jgi:hypothetical protein
MSYVYAPMCNQLDGVMQPMNPLDTGNEGYSPMQHQFFLGESIDETPMPIMSPMIRSDVGTPTVDILNTNQFAMPALNGGLGAVQDALSVLAVVDLLSR